jgi:hypothetical protein
MLILTFLTETPAVDAILGDLERLEVEGFFGSPLALEIQCWTHTNSPLHMDLESPLPKFSRPIKAKL